MNFKKIAAGAVASVVAFSALAITASADHIYQPTEELSPYLTTNGGNWLYRIYNEEESEAEGPAVSRDFGPWEIAHISFYGEMTVADDSEWTLEDYDESIDGSFSGCIIYSANGGGFGTVKESPIYNEETGQTYYGKWNWPSSGVEFWALPHKEDSYEGRPTDQGGAGTNTGYVDYSKPVVAEYIKQYNYAFEWDVPEDLRWPDDPVAGLYRVGYAAWSDNNGIFKMKINLMICRDDNGEILIATDYLGNEISGDEAEAMVAKWREEGENEVLDAPADDGSSDSNGSSDSSNEGSNDSNGSDDASSNDGNSAATTTSAPSSSETSDSSSNSSTPIIIGIIIAVVVIVIIIIAVVVVKKKK